MPPCSPFHGYEQQYQPSRIFVFMEYFHIKYLFINRLLIFYVFILHLYKPFPNSRCHPIVNYLWIDSNINPPGIFLFMEYFYNNYLFINGLQDINFRCLHLYKPFPNSRCHPVVNYLGINSNINRPGIFPFMKHFNNNYLFTNNVNKIFNF